MASPTVTSVSPPIGTHAGGASITIKGTHFTGTLGVTVGGTAATGVTVVDDSTLTCKTPAGTAGATSVVVTNGTGSNEDNGLYVFVAAVPTDTYIYLKGGRGDGFVPLWTGFYTDTLVDEKSEPYRDIFPASTALSYSGGLPTTGTLAVPAQSGLIFTDPVVTPPAYSSGAISGGITGTLTATTSDDFGHVSPRQYLKSATWRHYLSSSGLSYAFRLANIDGIGSKPRAE